MTFIIRFPVLIEGGIDPQPDRNRVQIFSQAAANGMVAMIESPVERARGAARQVLGRDPHRHRSRLPSRLPIAISDSVVRVFKSADP